MVCLYNFFVDLDIVFLEIKPLIIKDKQCIPLDMKIDDTALFQHQHLWKNIDFIAKFGEELSEEEKKIQELDRNTGAALKFHILNPNGSIWMLIAGGGASVIYTDTIASFGYINELANYGEYSGNPSSEDLYHYTKTILHLMKKSPSKKSKILLIGGGIANFTDITKTFTGIIQALRHYK